MVICKLLFLYFMHTDLYFSFYHANRIDMQHNIIHKYIKEDYNKTSDEFDYGRNRTIHSIGVTCH